MPAWLKVILLILVIGIALAVLAVFLGIRWFRSHEGELREQGRAVVAEGQDFGRGKDAEACVAESFARLKRCDGFICEAKTKVFLQHCVSTSNVPPAFCEGVPRRSEILASATWALEECARRRLANDRPCTRLVGALQEACEKR
jgi:hypothetical protein